MSTTKFIAIILTFAIVFAASVSLALAFENETIGEVEAVITKTDLEVSPHGNELYYISVDCPMEEAVGTYRVSEEMYAKYSIGDTITVYAVREHHIIFKNSIGDVCYQITSD